MRLRLYAHVEPYGGIESHFLLDQQVGQFVFEGIAGSGISKISTLFAPANDSVGHAADQLANGPFPLIRSWLAVEILAGDDVGRGLRPGLGDFDIFLPEDGHAFFVADEGHALFPFDRVEGRPLPVGKVPRKGKTFPRACGSSLRCRIRHLRVSGQSMLHGCHLSLQRIGSRQRAGDPTILLPCQRQGGHASPQGLDQS